jgi:GNAT superfamily N-acetyltransferase
MGALLLMEDVTLRRLQPGDLADALKLTQAERWSHRMEDWQFHHSLGLGWAACDSGGKLLGTASWWPYGDEFATVGLVLVSQEHQGQGIGRKLMNAIIDEAGSRTLQLIATPAGLTLYQRCGFRELHAIGQHQGTPAEIPAAQVPPGTELRPAAHGDLALLSELDAAAFGANRRKLISAVLESGTGVLAVSGGQPTGFALARQSGRGTVIGPVVAPDESLAIALIAHQLTATSGFARVDIPADAVKLARWLEAAGLACVDRVTVMRRGHMLTPSPRGRVFALASQALN